MNAIYILFTENMIIIIFIVFLLKPIFIYILRARVAQWVK